MRKILVLVTAVAALATTACNMMGANGGGMNSAGANTSTR